MPVDSVYMGYGVKGCKSIYENLLQTLLKIIEVQGERSAALNYEIPAEQSI